MATALVLFAHAGVPLVLLVWLLLKKPAHSKLEWLADLLAVAAVFTFLLTFGSAWHWIGMHSRGIYVVALGLVAYRTWFEMGDRPWLPSTNPTGKKRPLRLWISAGIALAMFGSLADVRTARTYEGDALRLKFPLVNGVFHVDHGGASAMMNKHSAMESQKYALDLSQLGPYGFRANGLRPGDPSEYAIFGTPIFAPCRGKVLAARDDLADQSPPRGDSQNPAGNHLLIECDGATLLLAHLKQGSVETSTGVIVEIGQRLAAAGNSGNSTEPHLHLHAVRGATTSVSHVWSRGDAVALSFDGNFYIRNDVINPPRRDVESSVPAR